MSSPKKQPEIDFEQEQIEASLLRARDKAWRLSLLTGTPFIVYRDGKVVDLNDPPRKISLPKFKERQK